MAATFEPSNLLREKLSQVPRNIKSVRGALIGYITADPAFENEDFDNAIDYVKKYGVTDLFEQYDDSTFSIELDQRKWTKEYYSLAIVYLKNNFCQERIDHIKDVARVLYSTPVKEERTAEIVANVKPVKKKAWVTLVMIMGIILLLGMIYWMMTSTE